MTYASQYSVRYTETEEFRIRVCDLYLLYQYNFVLIEENCILEDLWKMYVPMFTSLQGRNVLEVLNAAICTNVYR